MFNIANQFLQILAIVIFAIWFFSSCSLIEYNHFVDSKRHIFIIRLLISVIIGVVYVYFLVCVYFIKHDNANKTALEPNATEYIVALQDSNDTNGKFYFRYGYIETSLYINYIVDTGDNKYIYNKIPFDNTTIRYTTTDKPRVEWYKERISYSFFYNDIPKYYLYVPRGTIIDNFSIDLK